MLEFVLAGGKLLLLICFVIVDVQDGRHDFGTLPTQKILCWESATRWRELFESTTVILFAFARSVILPVAVVMTKSPQIIRFLSDDNPEYHRYEHSEPIMRERVYV